MICLGHQHGLPCLDLKADVSTIWLVGPQTGREEIRDLYYQVYKSRRWPRSPPCRPEWAGELMRDIVSSLKNCLRQKEDKLLRGWRNSEFADTHPIQNRTPWKGRWGTSAENELTEVREAHWRALATTIMLEEKIQRLSWSFTRGHLDTHAHSQSHNRWSRRSWGGAGGTAGPCWRAVPPTPPCIALHGGRMKRLNHLSGTSTWGPHQSWGLMWNISSRS